MRSSMAGAMAVTVLLASGCALQGLSFRERVEQSEWLQVNKQYIDMWVGRERDYGETLRTLLPEEGPSPVGAYFYTLLRTTRLPSEQETQEAWAIVGTASEARGRHEQIGAFLEYIREDPLLERIGLWMRQQHGTLHDRAERHRVKAEAYFASPPRSEVARVEFVKRMIEIVGLIEEQGIIAGRADELHRLAADLRAHAEDVARVEVRDAARWRAEQARWDAFSDWLRRQEERHRDERLLDALRRPRTCIVAGQTITCY